MPDEPRERDVDGEPPSQPEPSPSSGGPQAERGSSSSDPGSPPRDGRGARGAWRRGGFGLVALKSRSTRSPGHHPERPAPAAGREAARRASGPRCRRRRPFLHHVMGRDPSRRVRIPARQHTGWPYYGHRGQAREWLHWLRLHEEVVSASNGSGGRCLLRDGSLAPAAPPRGL